MRDPVVTIATLLAMGWIILQLISYANRFVEIPCELIGMVGERCVRYIQ